MPAIVTSHLLVDDAAGFDNVMTRVYRRWAGQGLRFASWTRPRVRCRLRFYPLRATPACALSSPACSAQHRRSHIGDEAHTCEITRRRAAMARIPFATRNDIDEDERAAYDRFVASRSQQWANTG